MSVTYLMQYSVQYIIAPVILFSLFLFWWDKEKKMGGGLASLSMKNQKAKVEFTWKNFCDF